MSIPNWLKATIKESIEKASVNFSDATGTYEGLLELYSKGQLDEKAAQAVEEIQSLLNLIEDATGKLDREVAGLKKIAAPPATAPISYGDANVDKLLKESPPMVPSPVDELKEEPKKAIPRGKLPPKIKQPETTKWKEIRFNKRTGTWQVVVTIRHTRNFLTENEAVDFTKKASKQ